MKPNGTLKLTITLSTEDRLTSKTPTIWDFVHDLPEKYHGQLHIEEAVNYDPLLACGRYAIENAEAELEQRSMGGSECADFLLTIDATTPRAAVVIRRRILSGDLRPNVHSNSDAEAISGIRAA